MKRVAFLLAGCLTTGLAQAKPLRSRESTPREEARVEKSHALKIFGRFGKVVGVGITRIDDGYGLKVNFKDHPALNTRLPKDVHGVPVKVDVVGPIRKR